LNNSPPNAPANTEDPLAQQLADLQIPVQRCALMLTGDADEAASLTQAAMAKAWELRTSFRTGAPLYPWLRGIVVNLARQFNDRRRRHAQATAPDKLDQTPHPTGRHHGALSAILKDELETHMAAAVSNLPAAFREAFVLHYIEDLPYAEISRLTGETETALRTRASRAKALLKSALGSVVDTWIK
jgi:RNA polymerase sigma-70 factor (ECF subfamily)